MEDKKADEKVGPQSTKRGDSISLSDVRETSNELDATETFLRENNLTHDYLGELLSDQAAVKRLVRKVDFVLLPLLAGTGVLQCKLDAQSNIPSNTCRAQG